MRAPRPAKWLARAVAGTAVLIGALSDAHAVPSARLVYVRSAGAESCPDEASVRAAVAARLGYDPFFPFAQATMIADISREQSRYVARIKLVGPDNAVRGTRELVHDGPSCSDIIDTMALTMSIAIDPDSLARGEPAAASADPSAVKDAPAAPPEPTPPPPVAEAVPGVGATVAPERDRRPSDGTPRTAWRLDVGAGPSLFFGAAPATNVAGHLFARARIGSVFSLALEGRYDLPASRSLAAATVETSLVFGALVPCAHYGVFAGCAVAAAGSLSASSRGVSVPRDDSTLHGAVGPRAALEVQVGPRVAIRANLDALFTLSQPTLELNGKEVYTLPRFSAGAGLGVVMQIF